MSQAELTILLANPRGFCAGVERAIDIVERALVENGPPVYVRHEIVHNRHVVDGLRAKGAVFVEELDEVPENALVVFSAHGVPKAVPAEARRRRLIYADATCPLVSKVHRGVEQHYKNGRTVLLIGHTAAEKRPERQGDENHPDHVRPDVGAIPEVRCHQPHRGQFHRHHRGAGEARDDGGDSGFHRRAYLPLPAPPASAVSRGSSAFFSAFGISSRWYAVYSAVGS